MTEQRNTSLVKPSEADLFREAKEQIDLLAYLAERHKTLDGQFPAHFQEQAADALMTLHSLCVVIGRSFLKGEKDVLSRNP